MKKVQMAAGFAAALLAAGCQKTYEVDVVNNEIGFSTEVGKQTKAIITSGTAYNEQAFTVYALGVQGTDEADGEWTTATEQSTVMDKVKIVKSGSDWKAENGKYYWPNNPHTTLSFFAYSPDTFTPLEFSKDGGLATGADSFYTHEKFQGDDAVDFMTASALDQKYSTAEGVVALEFKHQMTQLAFTFGDVPEGMTIKLVSLTLKDIKSKFSFVEKPAVVWTAQADTKDYKVFSEAEGTDVTAVKVAPVTMVPQNLTSDGQKMEIVYSISGTGVATETVTKTVDLTNATLAAWAAGQKVTYNITVGMNEIKFNPSVVEWTSVEGGSFELK